MVESVEQGDDGSEVWGDSESPTRSTRKAERLTWVYVCHPYSDDPAGNIRSIQAVCRQLVADGYMPVAPQLLLPQFVDEATERKLAMRFCIELIAVCDEMYVYGGRVTAGMALEIPAAELMGVRVLYVGEWPDDGVEKRKAKSENEVEGMKKFGESELWGLVFEGYEDRGEWHECSSVDCHHWIRGDARVRDGIRAAVAECSVCHLIRYVTLTLKDAGGRVWREYSDGKYLWFHRVRLHHQVSVQPAWDRYMALVETFEAADSSISVFSTGVDDVIAELQKLQTLKDIDLGGGS